MTDPTPQSRNIDVKNLSQVSPENLEGFKLLLTWLLSFLPFPELLAGIWIVPDNQIPIFVNKIIETVSDDAIPYVPGNHSPSGVAVPVEYEDAFSGFVLLDASILNNLSPNSFYDLNAASTISEELLHIHLYSLAWKRRGYILYKKERFGCQTDLYTLCSQFHDEYAVNRIKTAALAANASVQSEDGNHEPVKILYGGSPIAESLNQSAVEIRKIISDAATSKVPIDESWTKFLRSLYRGILEPLSRNEAYVAVHREIVHPNSNANQSWFYKYFHDNWQQIVTQLERSFASEFSEEEAAIVELVAIVDSFIKSIGVTHKELADGQCWVHFSTSFFDNIDY